MAAANKVDDAEAFAKKIALRIRALPSLRTEPVRAVRRKFSKRLSKMPAGFVIDLALLLLDEPAIDRFVAYELVKHHRAAFASLREDHLEDRPQESETRSCNLIRVQAEE